MNPSITLRAVGALKSLDVATRLAITDRRSTADSTVRARTSSIIERVRSGGDAELRALALELGPLRVNIVAPGMVTTEMWDELPAEERQKMYAEMAAKLPVGRVANALEVAETYLYLMRQTFSTGQVIVVDGGGVLI